MYFELPPSVARLPMFNDRIYKQENHKRICAGLLQLATVNDLGQCFETDGSRTDPERMIFAMEHGVPYERIRVRPRF